MHKSVMLEEAIKGLNLKEDSIVVDATLGYAGHSKTILNLIPKGYLIALDQDEEAIKYSTEVLSKIGTNFKIIKSNFEHLKTVLNNEGINHVDAILFDIGVSSPQIDDETRGFSFMKDALLDMRMDREQKLTAYDVVNNYSYEELTNIFYKYAEEKYSRIIATNIIKNRPITKTLELVKVIQSSVPKKYAITKHPERVIFQAIRIEVNHELDALESVLPDAIEVLNSGGRISVITFHSLEDRIVKQIFKSKSEVDKKWSGLPDIPDNLLPTIKLINKKPILPSKKEMEENSRSKSAKLRIIERI